jgi:hypothetical protein
MNMDTINRIIVVNHYGAFNRLNGANEWMGQPSFLLPKLACTFEDIILFLKEKGIVKWDVVAAFPLEDDNGDWWPSEWPIRHNCD